MQQTPEPSYTVMNTFGSNLKQKMTFGRKYSFKPTSNNPGPGFYSSRFQMVESRSTSAVCMDKNRYEQRSQFLEMTKTDGPDVLYNSTKPFGSDVTRKIDFG
jgi:hypothetical protein